MITSSALIFVPKGMKHCRLILRRVDRPIFHFSVLTGGHCNYFAAMRKYTDYWFPVSFKVATSTG